MNWDGRTILCIVAGLACTVGGAWLSTASATSRSARSPAAAAAHPVEVLRNALRPLALPFAWQSLVDADQAADRSRWQSRGRLLMELLPEWTDGHIFFACQEALEPSDTAEIAADRLESSLAWLSQVADAGGPRTVEVYGAMALLVDAVASDEARIAALESAFGIAPEIMAQGFRNRAAALDGDPATQERRIFGEIAVLHAALRARSPDRARRVVAAVLPELETVRDRPLATRWRNALENLDQWLAHRRKEDLDALEAEPLVQDLLPALRELAALENRTTPR